MINPATRREFAKADQKQRYRMITQLRREKHGALHDVKSAAEWNAQCAEIAGVFGFSWPALTVIADPRGTMREVAA